MSGCPQKLRTIPTYNAKVLQEYRREQLKNLELIPSLSGVGLKSLRGRGVTVTAFPQGCFINCRVNVIVSLTTVFRPWESAPPDMDFSPTEASSGTKVPKGG
jgi:hypothetical protein